MHAIGDIGQRVVFGIEFRPQRRADARRNGPMNAADAVLKTRSAYGQRGHVELLPAIDQTQRQQFFLAQTQLPAHRREVILHGFGAEIIVSSGHRRMGGKHGIRRDCFERGTERQALRDQQTRAFENQKRRVAFIDVPGRRFKAQFAERTHAADAQHDFLLQAGVAVATIQTMGNAAIRR